MPDIIPPLLAAKETPLVKTAKTGWAYVGPEYSEAIYINGVPYRPLLMSETQIEQGIADKTLDPTWFKKA